MTESIARSRGSRLWIHVGAVVLAAIYVAWAPHTADLAGQTARAELFGRSGFVPYWTGWYAGLPTTGYSLTTPPLLGWFGAVGLGAIAIVATSLVAVPLLQDARRPAAGAQLLVIMATLDVVSGRATFAAGLVVGLAALLAIERSHGGLALVLAVLATVTSPVAGFLLLVIVVGMFLVDHGRRRVELLALIGVLAALALEAWLSRGSSSGYEPLTRTSVLMAIGTALVVVVAPVGRRVRSVAEVSILMLIVVFFVHSAIGANATRLAILGAAPAVVAASRSRVVAAPLTVLALLLPLAQLHNDISASRDGGTTRSFVAPLRAELAGDTAMANHRLEVVDTATHWPSTYLLPTVSLARGWERQVDEQRNPLFYGRAPLTAASYRAFLERNAVGAVAVPSGVKLDYGATREAALVASGLSYLHQIWSDTNWRLYAVDQPAGIVPSPLVYSASTDTGLRLVAPAAGRYELKLRWSPYLVVNGGSVSRATDGDAVVTLTRPGPVWLHGVWRIS